MEKFQNIAPDDNFISVTNLASAGKPFSDYLDRVCSVILGLDKFYRDVLGGKGLQTFAKYIF